MSLDGVLQIKLQDQHGNPLGINGFGGDPVWVNYTDGRKDRRVESSRVEGVRFTEDTDLDTIRIVFVIEESD